MNYRLATVLAREAVSGDTTKVIDLNLVDPVSQFQVVYESLGAGGGSADAHAARCVTKIELIDGSDVLFSLSGQEAQAVDWYHNLCENGSDPVYVNTGLATMVFPMNFGRYLWDTMFAFDPRKFSNPQLKITIDVDAGGVGSSSGFLTVLGFIFDEKAISPEGFLMHKEVKNYGLGSATHEYTDMPTDYPYRKLFVAAQVVEVQIASLLDTIKLTEDNDRRIPINNLVAQLLTNVVGAGPPYRETVLMSCGAPTGSFYCTPCFRPRITATSWEVANMDATISLMGAWGGKGTIKCSALITGVMITVTGYAPHGAIEIPFGLQNDPADWYDVTRLGSLSLDILSITGRTSADTVQVYLQQLRRY